MKKLLSMMLVFSLYLCSEVSASQISTERIARTDFDARMSNVILEIKAPDKQELTVKDICGAVCFVTILAAPHVLYAYLQNNQSA